LVWDGEKTYRNSEEKDILEREEGDDQTTKVREGREREGKSKKESFEGIFRMEKFASEKVDYSLQTKNKGTSCMKIKRERQRGVYQRKCRKVK